MKGRRIALAAAATLAILLLALPAMAMAAGRVYWTDNTKQIPFAALDGSGGGLLPIPGGTLSYPVGSAIDSATGRIYWVGESGGVSFANFDGSGRDVLNTSGATFNSPFSATIDPQARRIYWANSGSIGYANLDGSGGGTLNTGSAPTFAAEGVAVDPAAGRIYWATITSNEIGYANLDGSGGGALETTGASVSGPDGVAVDPVTARLYWSNNSGAFPISYANLDGSGGGGNLNVAGGNTLSPRGIAIDPVARRVYWAEEESPGSISYADLGGSGGAVLSTTGASLQFPGFPVLQNAPRAVAAPSLSNAAAIGSTLTCSQGSWAPDQPGSQLYQAPNAFSYGWLRDGTEVAGATTASYVPASAGAYACRVTAANAAGTTAQASATVQVKGPTPLRHHKATVAGTAKVKGGKAQLQMRCPAGGSACNGTVKLTVLTKTKSAHTSRASKSGKRAVLGKRGFQIPSGKARLVPVELSSAGRKMLGEAPKQRLKNVKVTGKGVKHHSLTLHLVS